MMLLRWIISMFTFAQRDGGGGGGDPEPTFNTSPDPEETEEGREENSVIGGYAYQPRYPSMVGGFGPHRPGPTDTFTPYRTNDLHRILAMLNNQSAILDLQESLLAAGLLTGTVNFGVIDGPTEDAFEMLLTYANQNAMQWRDVLSQGAQSGAFATTDVDAAPLSPSIIALPNRDDLDASFEETGMTLTGERLDDDLRSSAVEAILDSLRTQQERQVQREMNLAGTGSGVAFVESAPDVNRLLEEEVRERAPQKVMNKSARDAMDTWFAMIGEQA